MTRILVQARGAVGEAMGSTGVRCYHMARVLAEQLPEARVTLAIPNESNAPPPHPALHVVQYRNWRDSFFQMLRNDIIISRNFPPHAIALFPSKTFVLDFYAAFLIEWIEITKRIPNPNRRRVWMASNRHYMEAQLTLADFIVCANERQRDAWVGMLATLGLIPPAVYDADSTLRRLIDVAPYGVQPDAPRHTRQVLKGVVPGIRESDTVLLWNGSIMEWFDTETVIRAMAKVCAVRDDVKLFFLGTEHPDWVTSLLYFDKPRLTVELSKELGLYDKSVFFNVGWVPYEDIGNYLTEADIGVCAGFDNMETHYAFRTRYVDLFWAGRPMVCTRGDVLADRVEDAGAGLVVTPGDADAYADAILRLVEDRELYARAQCGMAAIRDELSWQQTLRPLVEFCRSAESIAAPKRRRFAPLLPRTLRYLMTHVQQRRMPY
jgi:glycosyltransferase involved in cell wall biosynthesis